MLNKTIKAFYHIFRYYNIIRTNLEITDEINFGSNEANKFFKEKLNNCKIYLEYGSGSSTLLAEKINKNYFSIEGDKNFYNKFKKSLTKNYILKELGYVYYSSIPILFTLRKFFMKKKAKKYALDILNYFEKEKIIPDLILIDGRYRVLCTLYLYNFFKNKKVDFTIIIDDYYLRPDYLIVEKFFEIKKIGRFAILEKLKNENPEKIIKTYSTIYM